VATTDPLYDTNGGSPYTGDVADTDDASDYYVDVIAYDNAAPAAQNWRIYDNVWGFHDTAVRLQYESGRHPACPTTTCFPRSFSPVGLGRLTPSNVPGNFFGAESYVTDIEPVGPIRG